MSSQELTKQQCSMITLQLQGSQILPDEFLEALTLKEKKGSTFQHTSVYNVEFRKKMISLSEFQKTSKIRRAFTCREMKSGMRTRKPEVEVIIKNGIFIERALHRGPAKNTEVLFCTPMSRIDFKFAPSQGKVGFVFEVEDKCYAESILNTRREYQILSAEYVSEFYWIIKTAREEALQNFFATLRLDNSGSGKPAERVAEVYSPRSDDFLSHHTEKPPKFPKAVTQVTKNDNYTPKDIVGNESLVVGIRNDSQSSDSYACKAVLPSERSSQTASFLQQGSV